MKESEKNDALFKSLIQEQLQEIDKPNLENNIMGEIHAWEAKKDRRRSFFFLFLAIILAIILLIVINTILKPYQVNIVVLKTHLNIFLSYSITGLTLLSLLFYINMHNTKQVRLKNNY